MSRFIIVGYSPYALQVDPKFLKTGRVIGFNESYKVYDVNVNMDFWVVWDDTYKSQQMLLTAQNVITCPMFIRDTLDNRRFYDHRRGHFWYTEAMPTQSYPRTWEEPLRLSLRGSTATAAVNLAIIMGATEIVLVGVDFIGTIRASGSLAPNVEKNAQLFNEYKELLPVPIYKTVRESPIDLPTLQEEVYRDQTIS
jgi:hypothetical protein